MTMDAFRAKRHAITITFVFILAILGLTAGAWKEEIASGTETSTTIPGIEIPCGNVAALIAAITQANDEISHPGPDALNLASGCTYTLNEVNSNYYGPNGLPIVTSEIIVNGRGSTLQREAASSHFRFFAISEGNRLTVNDLTFRGGYSDTDVEGGAIWLYQAELSVNGSAFYDNYSAAIGGAIGSVASSTVVRNSLFQRNSAWSGGAIIGRVGMVEIYDSQFLDNPSRMYGGAIWTGLGCDLMIVRSTFLRNSVDRDDSAGGAVFAMNSLIIEDSEFTANWTGSRGGAVFGEGGSTIMIRRSLFQDNVSKYEGGAVFFPGNNIYEMTIEDSDFTHNSGRDGGAVYTQSGGVVTISGSSFSDNTAVSGNGGSLYARNTVEDTVSFAIHNNCFVGNGDTGMVNGGSFQMDASVNWWGRPDGPSGAGPGLGDSVGSFIDFADFLTEAPEGCATLPSEETTTPTVTLTWTDTTTQIPIFTATETPSPTPTSTNTPTPTPTETPTESSTATSTETPLPIPVDFYLHGSGSFDNPSVLFLDVLDPVEATAKYKDSPGINFNNGNPWRQIGEWTSQLSPAVVGSDKFIGWIGLKNSDDQGTKFDMRVEVRRTGVLVAEGNLLCVTGVTRNPSLAKQIQIPLAFLEQEMGNIELRIFTRIGTYGGGGFCGGHYNATGIRLYFDSVYRPSAFTIFT
jgi:hypothetical protein